ncbi:MAG TPA: LuxR C-terminal-related transcriptional regulator [Solirubrobacteraceae bacterium]|jgi:DNA-binding CsgD family transcriptional regulator|nr:LuxR C-terminal-related transcriptional regulator [Solirubrobacteraceae bacterium]
MQMVTTDVAHRLLDRDPEREVLDRFLECARDGQSRALVVRGEPGIGKSALLDYAIQSASVFRIARVTGVESELELCFAVLQQLCAPMLDRLERLPGPQREALRVAFGLTAGHPPDRFLVALGVLSLLSEVADEQPLLVVVDDAQWLDQGSAQALAFVARRLLAEPVGLLLATREPSQDLNGLPDLVVEGLCDDDARALLASALHARVDREVEQELLAETRGNPLALLELPRGLTATELAGGFGVPVGLPLSRRIEEAFRRRLVTLPADTRQLLVVAAAEPVGDPVLVWRAAEWLGIRVEAAEPAEAEELVTFGSRVTFRHPVVRSVVYQSASLHTRRAAHTALAQVIDPQLDPDRRAWHRAQAAPGPDEEVASELERSAGRAEMRGGAASAAAFLERAAALTLDPARRAERALAAARAKYRAGAFESALGLLATAKAGPLTELQHAQIDRLRGQITFASTRGPDAPPLLLVAAKRFEPLDAPLARDTYLQALTAALFAGRLASGGVLKAAKAAKAGPPSPVPPRASDLLLDGMVLLITEGHAAAAAALRRAVDAFRNEEVTTEEGLRWVWQVASAAGILWDFEAWDVLSARLVKLAREGGALPVLTFALPLRSTVHVFAGEFAMAASLIEEADSIANACGGRSLRYGAAGLAAFRGHEGETIRMIEATRKDLCAAGEGMGLAVMEWATAVLYNGLGRYEDALSAAQGASEDPNEPRFSAWALAEQIEAAARTGHGERGADALRRLSEVARASGTDWALGIQARSRAVLSDRDSAECLYREAIDRLAHTQLRVDLARAHLLYGEWLRRQRRRADAREQLRHAHESFLRFGAEAFAERARVELEATGERARKRTAETRDQLTPQELQISRLAAQGATNQEIAGQLFISPSTVDYHLRKAFRKVGVKSRTQLARHVLPS